MIIKNVRGDWVSIFEPNRKGKYAVCAILPNNHPQMAKIEEAIENAVQKGVADGKFTQAQTKSASFRRPLRDGTKEVETGEKPGHYSGHMFLNANNNDAPGVVGPDAEPLMSKDGVFSGSYFHVDIGFFPFSRDGNRGIGCGLNNVMFVKEGERLDGRQSAEQAFAGMRVEDDLQ